MQGDDNQIVPIDDSPALGASRDELRAQSLSRRRPRHDPFATHKEEFNDDLLAFIKR
jgi:hypothetical protein